nr:hypothetical protein RVX_2248 [Nitratidesulfovibrio sp. HK-II]
MQRTRARGDEKPSSVHVPVAYPRKYVPDAQGITRRCPGAAWPSGGFGDCGVFGGRSPVWSGPLRSAAARTGGTVSEKRAELKGRAWSRARRTHGGRHAGTFHPLPVLLPRRVLTLPGGLISVARLHSTRRAGGPARENRHHQGAAVPPTLAATRPPARPANMP